MWEEGQVETDEVGDATVDSLYTYAHVCSRMLTYADLLLDATVDI
jgi:hypothetical protein